MHEAYRVQLTVYDDVETVDCTLHIYVYLNSVLFKIKMYSIYLESPLSYDAFCTLMKLLRTTVYCEV